MPRVTPNLNLFVPDPGQSGIAAELNSNYDAIDGTMDPVGGHKHTGAPGAAPKIAVANIDATGTPGPTTYLRGDGQWAVGSGGGSGVTDHGALTGLTDDDHPQYHTQPRGDARWLQRANNLSDIANASAARTALDAAQTAHNHAAADVSSGVMAPARLGAGAASSSTYLRGDGQWATVAGTGVGGSGTPGRAAFWSAVSTLSGIANSIFFDAVNGRLAIGHEAPTSPLHVAGLGLGGGTSGTSIAFETKIDTVALDATTNVESHTVIYTPPTLPTGTRILSALVASVRANSAFNFGMTLRGLNGIAVFGGTGTLSGSATGQAGQAQNVTTGILSAAYGATGFVVNSAAGTITVGAALRSLRPQGAAGSMLTTAYGLYIEQQRPATGSVGTSYGVYQEGTLDQNTYKGPSQFDGAATFATQPAGIEKLFGWYDETTPAAATLGPTYPVTHDLTLIRSEGWAETVATGAAAQFDIQYKRGGGAWTSVFSTLPQFAVGANQRTTGTLSVTTLNAGDLVRRRWIGTPATIADVSVYLVAVTR